MNDGTSTFSSARAIGCARPSRVTAEAPASSARCRSQTDEVESQSAGADPEKRVAVLSFSPPAPALVCSSGCSAHRHGKGETDWRGAESTRSDPDQPPADRDSLEDGAADPRPGGRRRPFEAGLRQLRRAARRRGASPRTSSPRRICCRRRSFRHGPPRVPWRWRGPDRCRPPPGRRRRRTGRTG